MIKFKKEKQIRKNKESSNTLFFHYLKNAVERIVLKCGEVNIDVSMNPETGEPEFNYNIKKASICWSFILRLHYNHSF